MKVVITAAAVSDLERIGDHIAKDNPSRALSFVAELLEKSKELAQWPEAFPLVPRYEPAGVRRRLHGNYATFYRIERKRITVLHILHGARDYEALLFPDL